MAKTIDVQAHAGREDEDKVELDLELDGSLSVTEAQAWQRTEAWATWAKIKSGDSSEVTQADLDDEFDAALAVTACHSA